jgi:molybdopterin converting factor small subunit
MENNVPDPDKTGRGSTQAIVAPVGPEAQHRPSGIPDQSNAVRVRLPALFADRIDGVHTVEVAAATVEDALRALTDTHAALATLVWTAGGALNPVMVLFLNDRQLAGDAIAQPLHAGDHLEILPAIEGGSAL